MGTVIDIVLMFLAATGAISIVVCGVAAVFVFRHSGKIRRLSGRIKKSPKGFFATLGKEQHGGRRQAF